jgi:small subunit ribosomal protein S5
MSESAFVEKLIEVRRVTKVVKGGKQMSFAALIVLGDGNGRVALGYGKAREVPNAIQKAIEKAKKSLITVPIRDGTLYHPMRVQFGATNVVMLPASEGTGVIAGGAMRAVFEACGVRNVLTKVIGSRNAKNVIRATIKGLASMSTPDFVASKRGKTVEQLFH